MIKSFKDFDLDDRLLRALTKLNFMKPTLIQEKIIQLAIEGKDIIGKAKTGSGKSAAYLLPIINKILFQQNDQDGRIKSIKAIIIVPTRELCTQVKLQFKELSMYCQNQITALNVNADDLPLVMQIINNDLPDIIIGTPKRLLQVAEQLQSSKHSFDWSLNQVVIDEADLIFSFGFENDLKQLMNYFPKIYQAFIMSATLNDDVDKLKTMLLRNPVTVKLEEGVDEVSNIKQYKLQCKEEDKYLLLFYILKLKLIKGKCIVFVHEVDKGYKLKVFLEQFSIKCGVLNSELPANSKFHIIQQFNKGSFDYLIAIEEQETKNKKTENEFGVGRGIDFKYVAAVINFDFPTNPKSYTHRIGRTGRGNQKGTALSFVTDSNNRVYQKVSYKQTKQGNEIEDFKIELDQVENFRYRCEDALRSVKKSTIKEAKLKQLKTEILNNEKLQAHFKENPKDLDVIKHDMPLNVTRVQPQLRHIPEYLMPEGGNKRGLSQEEIEGISFKKRRFKKNKKAPSKKKSSDPLKKLIFSRKQ